MFSKDVILRFTEGIPLGDAGSRLSNTCICRSCFLSKLISFMKCRPTAWNDKHTPDYPDDSQSMLDNKGLTHPGWQGHARGDSFLLVLPFRQVACVLMNPSGRKPSDQMGQYFSAGVPRTKATINNRAVQFARSIHNKIVNQISR
jgi:hypothetical protein